MTAVTGMKLSTTQLGDLPGNKITASINNSATKQGLPFKKCIKVNVRRTAPSEHFIKASDKESVGDGTSSSAGEEDDLHYDGDGFLRNGFKNSVIPSADMPQSKPALTCPKAGYDSLNLKTSNNVSGSGLASNTTQQHDALKYLNKETSSLRTHLFNETQEKRLLEKLMQLDEDEDNKMFCIPTDEDLYQIWRNGGDSRRWSKPNVEPVSSRGARYSKHGATGKAGVGTNNNREELKPELFCAWETINNKKSPQKVKEDRKPKQSQSIYEYLHNTKQNSERNTSESSFMFFHYTDISRYIQQYRQNHVCENPYANHPAGCCHEASFSLQEVRDLSFPFKFDLATNSIRTRISNRINSQYTKENGQFSSSEQQKTKVNTSPVPGYLSPVTFRPPHILKPPALDTWNFPPESTQGIKYHLKKMWKSYERKEPVESIAYFKRSKSEIDNFLPERNQASASDSTSSPEKLYSNTSHSNEKKLDKPMVKELNIRTTLYSADKSLGKLKVRKARAEGSSPWQNKRKLGFNDLSNIAPLSQEEYFLENQEQDSSTGGDYIFSKIDGIQAFNEAKSRYEQEKNIRMKSLIAAEISHLQKRKVITNEQKSKLDKFRHALSSMSNQEGEKDNGKNSCKSMLPPSGSATKRFIAGSVRAYYTRTTNPERYISELVRAEAERECWGDESKPVDQNDDKPIIIVSQPHLKRSQEQPTQKPESPLLNRKLIGGKSTERKPHHPADAKQFTRITDLLRIRERQKSSRRIASGTSRGTSAAHIKMRRNSAGNKTTRKFSTDNITNTDAE